MRKIVNPISTKIQDMKHRNDLQFRRSTYLVLSDITHNALRRELIDIDDLLEKIVNGEKLEKISQYHGMTVIVLDSDDPDLILIG